MPLSRLKSRFLPTISFNTYDQQYIYDATALIAEEMGVLVDWDNAPIRQLVFMVGAAQKKIQKRMKTQT